MRRLAALCPAVLLAATALPAASFAKVLDVTPRGEDDASGTNGHPLRTIGAAARRARAGDTVVVHGGVYRETVRPARGGRAGAPITYRAAPGERVVVKGSERIEDWRRQPDGTWTARLSRRLFERGYNPYRIPFAAKPIDTGTGLKLPPALANQTLGEVYLRGKPLSETATVADVAGRPRSWKATADGRRLRANFGSADPNTGGVEVNVREQLFAPDRYNLGYITVRGFVFEHAANQFPDGFYLSDEDEGDPQRGAVSTSGGYRWVIEGNTVNYAKAVAIDFGTQGAVTRERAAKAGQIVQPTGRHLIRDNRINFAGTDGIMGVAAPFTRIEGNVIRNTNRFGIACCEAAGIKTHEFSGGTIEGNLIVGTKQTAAIWLDYIWQRARVTRNLVVDNYVSFWMEISHGPLLVDDNVVVRSPVWHVDSDGVTAVHNLLVDSPVRYVSFGDRAVPVASAATGLTPPAALSVPARFASIRYLNNVFAKVGAGPPPPETPRVGAGNDFRGNVALNGALPQSSRDAPAPPAVVKARLKGDTLALDLELPYDPRSAWRTKWTKRPGSARLGRDPVTGQRSRTLDGDFFAAPLPRRPLAGPFQGLQRGENRLRLRASG